MLSSRHLPHMPGFWPFPPDPEFLLALMLLVTTLGLTTKYVSAHIAPVSAQDENSVRVACGYIAAGAIAGLLLCIVFRKYKLCRAGHNWLGVFAIPMILIHSAGRTGQGESAVLTFLFWLITAASFVGLAVRHYLDPITGILIRIEFEHYKNLDTNFRKRVETVSKQLDDRAGPCLESCYHEICVYLLTPSKAVGFQCRNDVAAYFATLRAQLPETTYPLIKDLEKACAERRLVIQRRIEHFLTFWRPYHGPLWLALILALAIHIYAALRYGTLR